MARGLKDEIELLEAVLAEALRILDARDKTRTQESLNGPAGIRIEENRKAKQRGRGLPQSKNGRRLQLTSPDVREIRLPEGRSSSGGSRSRDESAR